MDDPHLLIDSFGQLTSISATLGGLAFTAAAALLSVRAAAPGAAALDRPTLVTAGAAVAGALCFVATMLLASLLAGDARAAVHQGRAFDEGLRWLSRTASLGFLVGLACLFVAIGASGWIGSRALGRFTSVAAGVIGGAVLLLLMLTVA